MAILPAHALNNQVLTQDMADTNHVRCRPLMEAHAHAVASSGGDVLNVGFGLGLVDEVSGRLSSSCIIILSRTSTWTSPSCLPALHDDSQTIGEQAEVLSAAS